MPNTDLTLDKIPQRCESRLGGKTVGIELEQDDWIEAIKQALDHYNQRRPFKKRVAISATPSQKRYVLDPATHPGLAGIVHVEFITRRGHPTVLDPFDPFSTLNSGVLLGGGDTFGELQQRLTYSEDAARIVDAEPEWHSQWEGTDYVLYLDIVRAHVLVSYEWSGYYTPDANPQTGMQLIPGGDVEWFLKYVTACAKETLGRVRGKFQGVTNPDGAQDPVDYVELLQEAQQEKEKLEEELNRRRPPLAPITE